MREKLGEQEPKELNESLVMSAEEYAEMKHATPYEYKIEEGNRRLYYFGAQHSQDAAHPMFATLDARLDAAKPDMVIVEGVESARSRKQALADILKGMSKEKAIETAGESGAALKWAQEHAVDFDCPEPSYPEQVRFLLERGYTRDQIFVHDLVRQAEQYYRIPAEIRPAMSEYMDKYIQTFQIGSAWQDFEYTFAHLTKSAKQIFGDEFDLTDPTTVEDKTDPIPWPEKKSSHTIITKLAQDLTRFRDERIVAEIAKAMKTHKRVFVVYGASHAVMQEPALRAALSKK